jgi:hypothetical protein
MSDDSFKELFFLPLALPAVIEGPLNRYFLVKTTYFDHFVMIRKHKYRFYYKASASSVSSFRVLIRFGVK